ncbi:MAG: hypothetical protein WAV38_24405, partial [Xanthobacteraceae bacterium]
MRLEEVFNRFSLSETLNDLIVFTDPAKDVGLCQITFHLLEGSIRRHPGLSIGLSWTPYCPHSDDQGPKHGLLPFRAYSRISSLPNSWTMPS